LTFARDLVHTRAAARAGVHQPRGFSRAVVGGELPAAGRAQPARTALDLQHGDSSANDRYRCDLATTRMTRCSRRSSLGVSRRPRMTGQ